LQRKHVRESLKAEVSRLETMAPGVRYLKFTENAFYAKFSGGRRGPENVW
jgi:hypothetical protein